MPIATIHPATGELIESFTPDSPDVVEAKLARAAAAFRSWRAVPWSERSARMRRAAEILEEDKDRWARLATLEMGKTLSAAVAEVEKCAWVCRFYAEHAESYLAPEAVPTDARESLDTHRLHQRATHPVRLCAASGSDPAQDEEARVLTHHTGADHQPAPTTS